MHQARLQHGAGVVARMLPQQKQKQVSAASKPRLSPGKMILQHVEKPSQPVHALNLEGDAFRSALRESEQLR
jgi:hypothetical protein